METIIQKINLIKSLLANDKGNTALIAELQHYEQLLLVERKKYVDSLQKNILFNEQKNDALPKKTDEIQQWFSNQFNEKFEWNKTKGIIKFENGAVYTNTELFSMQTKNVHGEFLNVIHKIKTDYSAVWLGERNVKRLSA